MSARDGLVDRLSIIGAVSRDTRNLRVDLLEQNWHLASIIEIVAGQHAGNEFAGIGVKSEMQKLWGDRERRHTRRPMTAGRRPPGCLPACDRRFVDPQSLGRRVA